MKTKLIRFRENWSLNLKETLEWFVVTFFSILLGLTPPSTALSLQHDYYTQHTDACVGWITVSITALALLAGYALFYFFYTLGNNHILNPFKRDPASVITLEL